jgi:hypothetical protein
LAPWVGFYQGVNSCADVGGFSSQVIVSGHASRFTLRDNSFKSDKPIVGINNPIPVACSAYLKTSAGEDSAL